MTPQILDELYVLIGSLKIVGFASAHEAMKKRLLNLPQHGERDPEHSKSGEEDSERDAPPSAGRLSNRTSRYLLPVQPSDREYRPTESARIAAQLLRPRPPIVAVVGDSGVGRTALLSEVARRLEGVEKPIRMWRIGAEALLTQPSVALKAVLDDVQSPAVVVIDDFDAVAGLGAQEADRALISLVASARHHPFARILLVVTERRLGRIAVVNRDLDELLSKFHLSTLSGEVLAEIVEDVARDDTAAAGLGIEDRLLEAALSPATSSSGRAHPGLALARIDAAIGRALLENADQVGVEHLATPAEPRTVEIDTRDMAAKLRARVRGQDEAIDVVASRLALTRAGLDLRPQRPNGVFLFAGPTGVGKTELATQIAVAEFGSAEALIRLDMSEYGEYAFGLSRLIGVGQGYVGQNEPEGWLTTKVARAPRSVVLLDEIEKAHPSVWNTFLQVFDAGRLTDGRGVTAEFSDTVVIMTSNVGVREASKRRAGFGATEEGAGHQRQLAAIKDAMAPELINRLDDIVIFNPLSAAAIVEIAEVELDEARRRLASMGWTVAFDEAVPRWLAETGYDATYGARHLMRNIEREFLSLLPSAASRNLIVRVGPEGLEADPAL